MDEKKDTLSETLKECRCNIYSIGTWLALGLAFLSGYLWQRGVRYKEHMGLAIAVLLIALIFVPWVTGTSIPPTLFVLIAAAGFALARYKDAPKVAFSQRD